MTDDTIMSSDGTEAATGHQPERAFEAEYAVEQGTHVEPTQVQHPWRAAVRTGIAVLVAVAAAILAVGPEVAAIADDTITPLLPAQLVDVLARISVAVVAVATFVTRVMNAPAVNAWLTRLGVGATPKV